MPKLNCNGVYVCTVNGKVVCSFAGKNIVLARPRYLHWEERDILYGGDILPDKLCSGVFASMTFTSEPNVTSKWSLCSQLPMYGTTYSRAINARHRTNDKADLGDKFR